MNGKRFNLHPEAGATVTAATKIRPEEAEALDALAQHLGYSRYECIRVLLREALKRAKL